MLAFKCKHAYNVPMSDQTASEIIDRLGGTVATAELCEVSSQAVSQWRNDGIPQARVMYLRAIRPEVFGINEQKAA